MDTKGRKWWRGGGGGRNWEIGIDIYTLICIKWITNKNVLYKKINKIKFKKNNIVVVSTASSRVANQTDLNTKHMYYSYKRSFPGW